MKILLCHILPPVLAWNIFGRNLRGFVRNLKFLIKISYILLQVPKNSLPNSKIFAGWSRNPIWLYYSVYLINFDF